MLFSTYTVSIFFYKVNTFSPSFLFGRAYFEYKNLQMDLNSLVLNIYKITKVQWIKGISAHALFKCLETKQ